ncbi:SLC13 family permease [Haloferax chudinovii]|uniref:SLC13 family permease n=1 Tax=Haloferax chudinovii TaxID=1109010 RepID=A0ABD5XHT2_9EURY
MPSQVLAVGITGGTFALLARPRIGDIPLSRAITSAVGAVLIVSLGYLSPEQALASLDTTTLLLLFGMLCHVEGLRRSGCYEWAAAILVDRSASARQLTLGTLGLSALLSAVALNDATVLLLTPILVTATRVGDIDPVLPLLAVILGANIGSLATPLGNPQNAFILAESGITTAKFVTTLVPVTVGVLTFTAVVLWAVAETTPVQAGVDRPPLDIGWGLTSGAFVVATLGVLVIFPSGQPGVLATTMGIVHIAWLQFYRRVPGADIVQDLDWGILVMFAGIFVLVGALEQAGVAHLLTTATRQFSLATLTFGLSNLVSNVPAVVLLAHTVESTGEWFVLAAVSTLAGVATPIGSAATLIVLDQARRENVEISLWKLLKTGFPLAVATSIAAVGVLKVV